MVLEVLPLTRRLVLAALMISVFALQFLLQPENLFPGDANAIRMESRYLIRYHTIGIPPDHKNFIDSGFLPPTSYENQYFWENKSSGKFYSRWGVANTVLYAIPIYLSELGIIRSEFDGLNILNIVLTVLFAAGIFTIASNFGVRPLYACVLCIVMIYGTYIFFYTRAQTVEIFHLMILSWCFAIFQILNKTIPDALETQNLQSITWNLESAALLILLLVLSKIYFIVFAGLFFLSLWWRRWTSSTFYWGAGLSVTILFICSLTVLLLNHLKFGSIWQTGLGPAGPMIPTDWFALSHFADSIPGYLWQPKYALASHMLPGAIGFLVSPWICRCFPRETFLGVGFFLSTLIVAGGWKGFSGEWCYGPRYMIQPLFMLACLCFPLANSDLFPTLTGRRHGLIFFAVTLAILFFGGRREFYRSYFDFFADKQVEAVLQQLPASESAKARWRDVSNPEFLMSFYDLCTRRQGQLSEDFLAGLQNVPEPQRSENAKYILNYCQRNFRYWK